MLATLHEVVFNVAVERKEKTVLVGKVSVLSHVAINTADSVFFSAPFI